MRHSRQVQWALRTLSVTAMLGVAPLASAVEVISAGGTYFQSFDSLTTSTSAVAFSNDSTLPGWSLFTAAGNAVSSYQADDGGSTSGSFYSYGFDASPNRSLGALGSGGAYFGNPSSGFPAGYFALAIGNDGVSTINTVALSYTGEQWRAGNAGPENRLTLSYSFGTTYDPNASWTDAGPTFDVVSLINGAGATGTETGGVGAFISGSLTSLNWAPGSILWLRWLETNDTGNDHGLAINDFSFTAEPSTVPLPAAAWLLLSGAGALGAFARRRRVSV